MSVKLLTEHYLEFLSLKGDCTGSSESALVKMPHCWKSHALAQMKMLSVYMFLHDFGDEKVWQNDDPTLSKIIKLLRWCLT